MSDSNSTPTNAERRESLNALLEPLSALETMGLPAPAMEQLARLRAAVETLGSEADAAEQRALEANQARAKFVSVVTHELRLPLTSIKGYTDLIRQGIVGPVNEQQLNFLGVVRSNVDRMTALIGDLADMSHAQSGRIKINPKSIRLEEVVDDVLRTLKPKLEEKNQECHLDLSEGPDLLQADPNRLAQVLGILLGNANRYTPAGGKIQIEAHMENDMVHIQVTDTGCGISKEDQTKLFTAFFRSEDEAVREHQGWGLSLHNASLLVGLMGGQIGAESELRKGSTFWIRIPQGDAV